MVLRSKLILIFSALVVFAASESVAQADYVRSLDGRPAFCRVGNRFDNGRQSYDIRDISVVNVNDGTAVLLFETTSNFCWDGEWLAQNIWDPYSYLVTNTDTEEPDDTWRVDVEKRELKLVAGSEDNNYEIRDVAPIPRDRPHNGGFTFIIDRVLTAEAREALANGAEYVDARIKLNAVGLYNFRSDNGTEFTRQAAGGVIYAFLRVSVADPETGRLEVAIRP